MIVCLPVANGSGSGSGGGGGRDGTDSHLGNASSGTAHTTTPTRVEPAVTAVRRPLWPSRRVEELHPRRTIHLVQACALARANGGITSFRALVSWCTHVPFAVAAGAACAWGGLASRMPSFSALFSACACMVQRTRHHRSGQKGKDSTHIASTRTRGCSVLLDY